ncbi:hypothetical protein K491DRAFT_723800 [Lophiostoma macrostomum CBS 122681]|uniref:Uncharacterized protein n=1 Tax=Lophiostoma macrostomum CBS 122681 TaxID=1314788 RepID=A0A6A6SJ47_9PLEO|nr:hypothetical protein K491DRAFT_723800 [Lophiostoma macrostomum CBS 122681]
MAAPTVLLGEFNIKGVSECIPGEIVRTYEDLEQVVYNMASKDPRENLLHFHFSHGVCEGVLSAVLWNTNAYFNSETFVKDGKLRVFAHFRAKGAGVKKESEDGSELEKSETATSSVQSITNSTLVPTMAATVEQEDQNIVYISDDSEDEGAGAGADASDSTNDSTQPRLRGGPANSRTMVWLYDPTIHPPLPVGVSPEVWEQDFNFALVNDAAPGEPLYFARFSTCSRNRRSKIAHARMILGKYGIESPNPCTKCIAKKKVCRIYHPALEKPASSIGAKPAPVKLLGLGATCAACRVNGFGEKCRIAE